MTKRSLTELEGIFAEMGLPTDTERRRYLDLAPQEPAPNESELVFIRLTSQTSQEEEAVHGQLA